MRRAFAIDVLACLRCGGRLRVIATVEDPLAVRQILAAAPLGPGPPPVRRHRALTTPGLTGALDL